MKEMWRVAFENFCKSLRIDPDDPKNGEIRRAFSSGWDVGWAASKGAVRKEIIKLQKDYSGKAVALSVALEVI